MRKVTQPVIVGEIYEFRTRDSAERLLRGIVLEILSTEQTARVRLTEPAPALRVFEPGPTIPPGETVRVYLPLVTATRIES